MTLLGFVFHSHHMGITWHGMIGVFMLNEHDVGMTLIIMVHFVLA